MRRLTIMLGAVLFIFGTADARTAADFDGRLHFFESVTVRPAQADTPAWGDHAAQQVITPAGWGDAPASAEGQTIGGLDQRDGANLPVNVVGDEGTDVIGKWNGTIIHEYGEWEVGNEVSLRLTDCDRNTMNISWRSRNRDGLGPLMRGPMGTCESRFELRAAGDHEFNINYFWHTQGNRRSTAQDSAPSRWQVDADGFAWGKWALVGGALGAVTAIALNNSNTSYRDHPAESAGIGVAIGGGVMVSAYTFEW